MADDPRLIDWEMALKNKREGKQKSKLKSMEEREPGPDSCFVLSGGRQRHGYPCLNQGKPQFGGGCWKHKQEPDPDWEPPVPGRPANRTPIRGGQRWQVLQEILAEKGIKLEDFVKELSPEELARGQLKNEEGRFVGAPPKWVPRAFMQACTSEILRRGRELYTESYVDAIKVMLALAHGADVESSVRFRAAEFVITRIEGKVPDKLIVEHKDSFDARVEELEAALQDDPQIQRVRERLSGEGSAAAG